MINLLSPNDKHQLQAARRNVMLLRYNIVVLLTLIAVGGIYGGSFFLTMQGKAIAQEQLNADKARTAGYVDVKTKIEQFSKNLTIAKTILSTEITYSSLITDIAKTLPAGTILTNLTLGPDSFGKNVSLSAAAKNYAKALELKNALEKSPLFSEVSIESVGNGGRDQNQLNGYPIGIILKTTFATTDQIQAIKKSEAKS